MIKIAVASGKGGTGKTTVSVNLFSLISKYWTKNVSLIDCDVEEPNDAIFLNVGQPVNNRDVSRIVPKVEKENCNFCKRCSDYCEFNAITIMPSVQYIQVAEDMCHFCGACFEACKFDAIKEKTISIGKIAKYETKYGGFIEGKLRVGSAMQTPVISDLKKETPKDKEVVVYDAPPGTSCPVVATVEDVDYVVLVTEPTPFGLNDLKLMVDLIKELDLKAGVVINKAGLGDANIYQYLKEENLSLLAEIPFDKNYASKYATGDLINNGMFSEQYMQLINNLKAELL
jgi:MinD superfamily P-loop ATPase